LASFLAQPSLAALAALGFLAFGLAAQAADIAVPGPAYYPKSFPPPAIYDWTGVYLGFHIGGGILTDSVSQNGAAAFNLGNSGSLRPAGVLGGGQIGALVRAAPSHSRRTPLAKQGRSGPQALKRRSRVAPCRSHVDRTFAGNSAFDALAKVQRSHYVR
jgi:hypothetical protein